MAFLSAYASLIKQFFQGSLLSMLLDTLTNRMFKMSKVSISRKTAGTSRPAAGMPGCQPNCKPTASAAHAQMERIEQAVKEPVAPCKEMKQHRRGYHENCCAATVGVKSAHEKGEAGVEPDIRRQCSWEVIRDEPEDRQQQCGPRLGQRPGERYSYTQGQTGKRKGREVEG